MIRALLFVAATLTVSLPARANEESGKIPPGLFAPTLLMSHQDELELTAAQRASMRKEVQATQAHLVEVQWQLHESMETLARWLLAPHVDEAAALAAADKVLGFEREVKRTNLLLLIRLKNLLTEAQQARARSIAALPPGPAPGKLKEDP